MHGKTMEVFWFDGTGDGIITAELSNWNGEAIKIPRKDMTICASEFEEIYVLSKTNWLKRLKVLESIYSPRTHSKIPY